MVLESFKELFGMKTNIHELYFTLRNVAWIVEEPLMSELLYDSDSSIV